MIKSRKRPADVHILCYLSSSGSQIRRVVGKPYKTHTKLPRIRAEKEIVLVDFSKKHNLHSFY